MSGGDTLYVKSGTYLGTFTVSNLSGTPTKTSRIEAFPDHSVTIEGSGVHTGRLRISGCHYLSLDGFEIRNMNQGIFIENESSNVTVRNCTVHNVGQEGIHVKQNSSYVTIENCTIYDTREWNYNGEGVYIGTGSAGPLDNTNNVIVRKCRIYNAMDEAIDSRANNKALHKLTGVRHNVHVVIQSVSLFHREITTANEVWALDVDTLDDFTTEGNTQIILSVDG
jgi:parallel beta-helix repeat protein